MMNENNALRPFARRPAVAILPWRLFVATFAKNVGLLGVRPHANGGCGDFFDGTSSNNNPLH